MLPRFCSALNVFTLFSNEAATLWFLYEVVIPLMSVGLVYIGSWLVAKARLFSIIRDGQLCFYCTTITAVLLRDLTKGQSASAQTTALLVILMIFTTFMYGAAVLASKKGGDEKKIGWTSVLTCLTTIILVLFVRAYHDLF